MPQGNPLPGDQGPLASVLRRVPGQRALMLDFGKPITFVLLSPEQARKLHISLRSVIKATFGEMTYNTAELSHYIRCSADHERRMLRIDFLPSSAVPLQGALAANPELFLALAEHVEITLQCNFR